MIVHEQNDQQVFVDCSEHLVMHLVTHQVMVDTVVGHMVGDSVVAHPIKVVTYQIQKMKLALQVTRNVRVEQ
jgi:hypothetical protein